MKEMSINAIYNHNVYSHNAIFKVLWQEYKDKFILDKCNYILKQLALRIRPDFMLVCEQECW